MTREQFKKYIKDTKIYLENSNKSKQLQEKLISLGINFENEFMREDGVNLTITHLTIYEKNGEFHMGYTQSLEVFTNSTKKLLNIDDVLNIEIFEEPKYKSGEQVLYKGKVYLVNYCINEKKFPHSYTIYDNTISQYEPIDVSELELSKYVPSKFKIGDYVEITWGNHSGERGEIISIVDSDDKKKYHINTKNLTLYNIIEDCIELSDYVPSTLNKIKKLQPFDKIIVRNSNENTWRCDFFSHIKQMGYNNYFVYTTSSHFYNIDDVLPYDGNEDFFFKNQKLEENIEKK